MINYKNVITIIKKELRSYFDSPTAYIVLIIFLFLWEFLFFRNVFLVGEASLRILFSFLPWLFLLLIPAITMGSISQEKSEGTLEFLLTHPLRDGELLLGKFLAALLFVGLALLFIFPIALNFNAFGNLDWGVVFGQYFASLFMASVFIALGVFISALLANQISSLLLSVAAIFFFIIAGSEIVTARLPLFLTSFLERLSVFSHFESMSRGVIDLRDLWYFLSISVIFLSLAYLQLLKRRFGNQRQLYRSYQIGILLFIGIVILTNVIGSRIPGRLDLTQDRIYTLSEASKNTLNNLDDLVNIDFFASSELPASLQPVLRDVKDVLRDYKTLGKGNIIVSYKNPSTDLKLADEARRLGVNEMQFNVIGQEEFKLKKGYLGLAVSYAGKNEAISFIQDTSDLEYQLTSFIKKLTTKEKKKIVFLSGHGEKNPFRDYQDFYNELQKQFEIEEATIDEDNQAFPENTKVLVIAGPTEEIDEETRIVIKDFIADGGAVLFLIDPLVVNPQALSASANQNSFADFVQEYGVNAQTDIVYDLRSNETVNFSGGFLSYLIPYPFWIKAGVSELSLLITSRLESITLPWASSLSINENKLKENKLSATEIFTTTEFSGRQTGNFVLTPDTEFSQQNLEKNIIAVSLSGEDDTETLKTSRMIVVGDSDFLLSQFAQNSPENLAFGMEALSWLNQEESLAGIQLKQRAQRTLLFENQTQTTLIKYGNMSLAFFLPLIFGLLRLMRRKNLRKFNYSPRL